VWQVRDSMGPLNQWPFGHLIMAALRGPALERMVNRHRTSAGSPHLTVPPSSRYAGQSRNIMAPPLITGSACRDGCPGLAVLGRAAPGSVFGKLGWDRYCVVLVASPMWERAVLVTRPASSRRLSSA